MNRFERKGHPRRRRGTLTHHTAARHARHVPIEGNITPCPGNGGVVVVDERRCVRYANQSFRAALGLDGDIQGADLGRLVPRSWISTVNGTLRRTGAGPRTPPIAIESTETSGGFGQLRFEAHPIAHTSLVVLSVDGIAPCPHRGAFDAQVERDAALAARLLSPREREVLHLVANGVPSKHIADQLGIALTTVETYRRQIMDKVQLRTVAELTKFAVRIGLATL